jgi:hypothetical protein
MWLHAPHGGGFTAGFHSGVEALLCDFRYNDIQRGDTAQQHYDERQGRETE